jgi:hypothetical protein
MDAAPGTPVTFFVKARTLQYEFSFKIHGSSEAVVTGTLPSDALKPLFTGVHLGVYAQGVNDTPCLNSAYFKYAKWDHVDV